MAKNRPTPMSEEMEILVNYQEDLEKEKVTKKIDLSQYADQKALEKYYRDKSSLSVSLAAREGKTDRMLFFDADKLYIKKRYSAILRAIPEARERYAEKYPGLCIEKEMVRANANFGIRTYDVLSAAEYTSLAAALWILDELELRGGLRDVLPILPDGKETEDVLLPEFYEDACFDESVIRGMIHVILNRNDDIPMPAKSIRKPYVSLASLKRADTEHTYEKVEDPLVSCETNRQKFDYIMSRLHPTAVERAKERFLEKEWEVFGCCLEIADETEKENRKRIDEIEELLRRQINLQNAIEKEKEERTEKAKSYAVDMIREAVLSKRTKPEEIPGLDPGFRKAMDDSSFRRKYMEDEMDRLYDAVEEQEERGRELVVRRSLADYWVGCADEYMDDLPDDAPEASSRDAERFKNITVKNPYETCFALLYLLDSGSHMPWIAPMGMRVMEAAVKLLPWHEFPVFREEREADEEGMSAWTEEDIEESEEDPVPDGENDGEDGEEREIADWIELEAAFYKRNLKHTKYDRETGEYGPDEKTLLNFPQFIYREANVSIPRNIYWNSGLADIYVHAGFDEKEAKLLEKYVNLAEAVFLKHHARLEKRPDDATDEEEEQPEEKEAADAGPAEAEELKKRIRQLREEVKKNHDEKRELIRETEGLREEKEELQKELDELRSMIRAREEAGNGEEEEKKPAVSFPYEAKGRYVVFGGHDSWTRAIRPLLRNVRFVDKGMKPDTGLILHADTIWLQSNAIGHSDYYKIINTVRTYGIGIEYFSFASAEKCAEQLAHYDMDREKEQEEE